MARRVEFTVSEELWGRVELARGLVPRAAWIKRALEAALSDAEGSVSGEQAGPGPVVSSEAVRPATSSRASVGPRRPLARGPFPKGS